MLTKRIVKTSLRDSRQYQCRIGDVQNYMLPEDYEKFRQGDF